MEKKRCAVVTGGNRGIGFEICQLALNGVEVILTSRNESRGLEADDKLNVSGLQSVIFHQLDIKDPSSIACFVKFVETHFKKLDILAGKLHENGWPLTVSAYKLLKAALNAYTRLMAKKLENIIVNCVITDMTSQNWIAKGPVMAALLPDSGPSGVYFDPFSSTNWPVK